MNDIPEISDEEIYWLCFGDETDQVMDKLLGVDGSILRSILDVIQDHNAPYANLQALTKLIVAINRTSGSPPSACVNESQLQRLRQLDQKYNLSHFIENDFYNKIIKMYIVDVIIKYNYQYMVMCDQTIQSLVLNCRREIQNAGYDIEDKEIKDIIKQIIETW